MPQIASKPMAILAVCLCVLVSSCASSQPPLQSGSDPFENFNRKVYKFNEKSDKFVLKPLAKGYVKAVPKPARQGVRNVFSNLGEPLDAFNGLLQGKLASATKSFGRFLINSTVGLFGLIDVATPMGIEKQDEDFGQTLAVWGVPSGPYIVLPFLGPTTVRDSSSVITGLYYDPLNELKSPERTYSKVLDIVDTRANFLDIDDVLAVQPDGYLFVKNYYQQRRNSLIFDGETPADPNKEDSDDLIDELLDN